MAKSSYFRLWYLLEINCINHFLFTYRHCTLGKSDGLYVANIIKEIKARSCCIIRTICSYVSRCYWYCYLFFGGIFFLKRNFIVGLNVVEYGLNAEEHFSNASIGSLFSFGPAIRSKSSPSYLGLWALHFYRA
jgi:hypothetical protein